MNYHILYIYKLHMHVALATSFHLLLVSISIYCVSILARFFLLLPAPLSISYVYILPMLFHLQSVPLHILQFFMSERFFQHLGFLVFTTSFPPLPSIVCVFFCYFLSLLYFYRWTIWIQYTHISAKNISFCHEKSGKLVKPFKLKQNTKKAGYYN